MSTIIIPNFLTEKVVTGLNTYQYTINTAAMHVARVRVSKQPDSGMTITINLNGSPVATTTLVPVEPGGGNSTAVISATMNCAANDVVTFVLSSSTSSDQQLNTIKAILNVHIGSSN